MSQASRSGLRRLRSFLATDREWFSRAARRRGRVRETLFVIAKSSVAAVTAWYLAEALVGSQHVAFAPFSALIVVQPTIYRSVLHSGRYVIAVVCGALLAGLAGLTVGLQLWSFALVVVTALAVGQCRQFGQQGIQLPVVAAFALAGGHAAQFTDLASLLAMVGVGSATAVLTNLVFAPAVRFTNAKRAVSQVAAELGEFLADLSQTLQRGWENVDTGRLHHTVQGFEGSLGNARATIERQEERLPMNPRRLLDLDGDPQALYGYRGWVETLGRVLAHLRSIVGTLHFVAREEGDRGAPADDFLRSYAGLLDTASQVLNHVRDLEDPESTSTSPRIRELLDDAFAATGETLRSARAGEFSEPERWQIYGALLTDVQRAFEELYEGHRHMGP